MSVSLSVPETAAALGLSERTVWRRIREGQLRVVREGRAVRVLLEMDAGRAHAVGEPAVAYGAPGAVDPIVGPWPYTAENVARQRERLRLRRLAALAEMEGVAKTTLPDPDGLTFLDYLHEDEGDRSGMGP